MQNIEHAQLTIIDNKPLLTAARAFYPLSGSLKCHPTDPYCYLDIQDTFIQELFPLIKADNLSMPAYTIYQK
jgi:hypothetical protein